MTNKTRKQRMERQIVELLRAGITKRQITLRLKVGKKRVNEVYKLALEHDYLNKDKPLPAFPEILFPERPDGRANRSSQVDVNLPNRKGWIEQKLYWMAGPQSPF